MVSLFSDVCCRRSKRSAKTNNNENQDKRNTLNISTHQCEQMWSRDIASIWVASRCWPTIKTVGRSQMNGRINAFCGRTLRRKFIHILSIAPQPHFRLAKKMWRVSFIIWVACMSASRFFVSWERCTNINNIAFPRTLSFWETRCSLLTSWWLCHCH